MPRFWGSGPRDPRTQRLQDPLIKEYTLMYSRVPNNMIKEYSLIKGYCCLWEPLSRKFGHRNKSEANSMHVAAGLGPSPAF